MNLFYRLLWPHQRLGQTGKALVKVGLIALLFLIWQFAMPVAFPRPMRTWEAFVELATEQGLLVHTWVSMKTHLQAVAISVLLSLPLAYLSVTQAFKPLVTFLCAWRGVSPGALVLLLQIAFVRDGHTLKVTLMTFAISVFYLTAMARVVSETTQISLNDAYTLKMSEWRSVWEVIVLGKLHMAYEALVQNNLMGWAMLMMVESLIQGEGGIGRLMFNDQKHSNVASLLALAVWSGVIGLGFDQLLRRLGKKMFKYVPREVSH